MNVDKNSEKIRDLKRMLWKRTGISVLFIVINIISAIYVSRQQPFGPYLSILNIVAAVICLPALIMPLVSLYLISRSSGVILETADVPPATPLSEIIRDARSRYIFTVRDLFSSANEVYDLVRRSGIDIVESHLDKMRAELLLTFAALNDAKGARNVLRFNNYNCTDVEEYGREN